jgi:hypothetical protein
MKANPRIGTLPATIARWLRALFVSVVLLPGCGMLQAQSGSSIAWFKIAGGGGTSSNGPLSLSGTLGQHDASPRMTGEHVSVIGGFWALPLPPAITTQPQSQTVAEGAPVTLSVGATGAAPLAYQWFRDGQPLAGVTLDAFSLPHASLADAGTYFCRVANSFGQADSSNAVLTVNALPQITAQPQSQTVMEGEPAAFTVAATGTEPLSYQWFRNGQALAGFTIAEFSLPHAGPADAGTYFCRVANGFGQADSSNALLTVNAPPRITAQPQSQTVAEGDPVTFNVAATGTAPLTYQWFRDGQALAGFTIATFSLPHAALADAGTYFCRVTNDFGEAFSSNAVLTVSAPPHITAQPQSQTVSFGDPVTLTVTAGGSTPLTYQWFRDGQPLGGSIIDTFTNHLVISHASLADAGTYSCRVTNDFGEAFSSNAILTVLPPPPVLTPPVLAAALLPGCRLQVCWTDPGSNYVLQSTVSLTPPVAWQDAGQSVSLVSTQSCAVLSNACEGTRFLRLALARLPMLRVLGPAVTQSQFAALAGQLNLPSTAYDTNGAVLFTDANQFMRLPTEVLGDPGGQDEEGVPLVAERLLFDQINQIQVVSDPFALQQAQQLFSAAGLMPTGMVIALPEVVHAQFSAVTSNGTPVCNLPIDTKVRYQASVGGLPIVGPGAKASITFGENGLVTHLHYSLRQVTAGPTLPLPPPHAAHQTALNAYQASFGQQPGTFSLTSGIVYYAPPTEYSTVQTLYPHYQFGGTFTPSGGSNAILLRMILIPAITDSNTLPRVQLVVGSQGNSISAQAVVLGGLAPYRYRWGSCTTVLAAPDSPSLSYQATGRSGVETLVLHVTDANGLSATASTNIIVVGNRGAGNTSGRRIPKADDPGYDVGTEWIGATAGLGLAPANAAGFVARFRPADALVRFNWGEGNAWERDFRDPLFGGDDSNWVDDVDAVFYTGHASGDGWVFTSSHDDGFLRYSEARYGQNDLEWLVIAACGPLQVGPAYNAWWQRWGPAFQGLHLLCGYDNNSNDTTDEGRKWADYMLRNVPVGEAWTRAGTETQSDRGLRVAVMGVYGAGGLSNRGDHFWGRGSVGPDIRSVAGYWLTLTPVD